MVCVSAKTNSTLTSDKAVYVNQPAVNLPAASPRL
jgi:hypothetical protein